MDARERYDELVDDLCARNDDVPRAPDRLRLPAGGAGLRRSLAPLAALQPAARAPALFHRPTHRERGVRNARP